MVFAAGDGVDLDGRDDGGEGNEEVCGVLLRRVSSGI
jgi:hypothetical protein